MKIVLFDRSYFGMEIEKSNFRLSDGRKCANGFLKQISFSWEFNEAKDKPKLISQIWSALA